MRRRAPPWDSWLASLASASAKSPPSKSPPDWAFNYVVNLDSVGGSVPGQVNVISATSLSTLASVPITYGSMSLSLSIPLTYLTDPVEVNSDVFFGAIIGTLQGPTDTLLGVPEPATFILACPAIAFLGWYAWGRRRTQSRP